MNGGSRGSNNCVTLLETMLRKKNILMTHKCAIRNLPSRVISQIISMEIFSLLKLNQQQNVAKLYKLTILCSLMTVAN